MNCIKPAGRGYQWTRREIERACELAFIVGLPCGSIAKLLHYEFGSPRTPGAVRRQLSALGWKGTPRGDPSAIRRQAA